MSLGVLRTPLEIAQGDEILSRKLEFLNSYITNRSGYAKQNSKGTYTTLSSKNKLLDYTIVKHLQGKESIAIKNNMVTKFITFDVDCKEDLNKARGQAKKIIEVLLNKFNIPYGAIVVSYSGNKGYHIDLLFNTPIKIAVAESFMKIVLALTEEVEGVHIDRRGGTQQAVKLPLGTHKVTGNFCNIVATDFSKDYDKNYIPTPCCVDENIIYNAIHEVKADFNKKTEDKKVEKVKKSKSNAKTIALYQAKVPELETIIKENRLLTRGTRNAVTFLLALYGNTKGMSEKETVELISKVLSNTPSELFNDKWSHSQRVKMAEKTVKQVFEENSKLYQKAENTVKVSDAEVRVILEECKTINEMNVALLHLINSKKYKGVYYLSGDNIAESTDIKRRQVIRIHDKLIEKRLITKVYKGGIVEDNKKANTYKCNISEMVEKNNSEKHITIEVSTKVAHQIQNISNKLFTTKEIKTFVSRRTYEHFLLN